MALSHQLALRKRCKPDSRAMPKDLAKDSINLFRKPPYRSTNDENNGLDKLLSVGLAGLPGSCKPQADGNMEFSVRLVPYNPR